MSREESGAWGRSSRSVRILATGLVIGLVVGIIGGIYIYKGVKTSSLTEAEAVVYVRSHPDETQREAIITEISAWQETDKVEFVSEVDRYDRLAGSLIDKRAMEGMTGNPFLPSFEIGLNSPLTSLQIHERLSARFADLGLSVTSIY